MQGHTASLTHRVQRRYGLGWDMRADHPDVPAVWFFSAQQGAKLRTSKTDMVHLHGCHNLNSTPIILSLVGSLFCSIWCRFRSRTSFGRTSIIRGVRRRLICFPSNLHVYRTQFLTDLFKDPFLSSVIFMVAPTWCHGALEATPVWVTEDRLDFRIYTF